MKTNNELDAQQQAAVDSNEPCIVCCAAAGSGKTRTLISRIQRLVRDGVDPAKIAAVTFTVAGAKVMQERLPGVRLGFIGNLHSLALRMLQQHAALVVLPATVTVLDDEAAAALLEQCRERLRVKCTAKELTGAVEMVRNGFTIHKEHSNPTKAVIVAQEYFSVQKREGTLDFDAILDYMLELVTGYADEVIQFDYLFCDEMQDAADIDWNIYEAMQVPNEFYVGDDSQSIFGFRGSNVRRFVELTKKLDVSMMNLSTNYRSSVAVIDAATTLIQHNKNRVENNMWAREGAADGSVEVIPFVSPVNELAWIANAIENMEKQKSIACLWRTNNLAQQCADYLRGLGVKVAEAERPAADTPEAKLGKARHGTRNQ